VVISLVLPLPPVYLINKDGSAAYVPLIGIKYKTAKKIPMNVSLDHMTVPLTLSAATFRAHSPALASQDFQEMAKYAKI